MSKLNKKKKLALVPADSALFQPISDEQAELVKGGSFMEYYCHIAKKIKRVNY
ncbi:MAG: hypothetical protein AAGC93_21065 [Cyanobacteria bacterium P01_F01_bin.53]